MTDSITLKDKNQNPIENALSLAHTAQLAYPSSRDINSDYKNSNDFNSDIKIKKKQTKEWGFDSFSYCYSEKKQILALIMGNDRDIIIAFRGTVSDNFTNWFTDIQVKTESNGSFGRVHKGFREALDSIWGEIAGNIPKDEKRNLHLTGHSLGGALALLAGTWFAEEYPENFVKEIITFGQPRIGDKKFRQHFNKSYLNNRVYKFANSNDLITVAPPYLRKIMEYVDVGRIGYFNEERQLEFFDKLEEFRTLMNFLSGYFHQHKISKQEPKKGVKNWRAFSRVFKKTFQQDQKSGSASSKEETDWEKFKQFFTKELPSIPRRQRPQKVQQTVLELLAQLFIRINPYGVNTHSISTYIENLKMNIDTPPSG